MCGIGKSSGAWLVRFPAQLGHLARTTLAMPYLTRLTACICILFGCLSQYSLATQGWCLVDSTCTSNFRKAHANLFVWSRKNGHGCARVASLQPGSMETKSHRVNPQLGPQTPSGKPQETKHTLHETGQAGAYPGYQSRPRCTHESCFRTSH